MPKSRKSSPAAVFITSGDANLFSREPATTARKVEKTRAAEAPRKTAAVERDPAAEAIAASWVLSPSSAKKMSAKVLKNSFQSMSGKFLGAGYW